MLPSIYSMGSGINLSCVNKGGFNSNPGCRTTANNEITIDLNTAKFGTDYVFIAEISDMTNPLFEGGSYTFTFEFVNFLRILFFFIKKICEKIFSIEKL